MAEYMNVNEFAEFVGVTSQAVYKRLPELPQYVRIINGRKYVESGAAVLFKKKSQDTLVEEPTNQDNAEENCETNEQVGLFTDQQTNEQPIFAEDKSQRELARLLELIARQQDLLEASERERQRLNDHILELTERIAKMGENAQLIAAQSQVLQLPHQTEEQEAGETLQTNQTEVVSTPEKVETEKTNRLPGWLKWLVNRYET